MKSSILALLVMIMSLSISSAFAVVGTPNELFRPMARKHVEMVLEKGINKIQNLNLKKLLVEIDEVEWRTFDLGFLGGSGGNRMSSIYMVESKMVVINMYTLQNMVGKPVPVYSWALHESLGALGYPDENYELSSSISMIANSAAEEINDHLASLDPNFLMVARATSNRHYSGDGGSTVVGGGGDMALIELKQQILKRYKKWIAETRSGLSQDKIDEGMRRITKINIEYDINGQKYQSVDFNFTGEMLLIDAGGDFRPELMYQQSYVDSVLEALSDYLFN